MRQLILIGLGILLIVGGFFSMKNIIASKKTPEKVNTKIIKTVYTQEVQNIDIPVIINAGGNLIAKNKIELFSEVQGLMQKGKTDFRTGNTFQKGSVFLSIDPSEYRASLIAQKSNFFTQLTSIMADLRLDYPESYPEWNNYLQSIELEENLPELPEIKIDKLKYFLSARNILTSYYQVKNMEVRLSKHTLTAPFTGVLTESNVNPGTLIRAGQKLGEFIKPGTFEMELTIPASMSQYLHKGKEILIRDHNQNTSYSGVLDRINAKVETNSQMIRVYVILNDMELKEGSYLEATLTGKEEKEVIEIPRNLLIENNSIFIVENNTLKRVDINPVFFKESTVIIRGLQNGTKILSKVLPGAYNGMEVKLADNQK